MERFQLMDTYKAYKVRERKFTTWLKEAAAKVGYKGDKSTEQQSGGPSKPIAIKINELFKLAKAIVDENPDDPCPLTFRQALRDVISQRKEAAEFYRCRAATDGKAAKSMEGHLHYIKVLEDIAKMFETSASRSPIASSSTAVSSTPTSAERDAQLSNLFELLKPDSEGIPTAENERGESEEDENEDNETSGKKKSNGNKKKKSKNKSKKSAKPTSTKSRKQKPIDMDMFDDHIEDRVQYELEEEDHEYEIWFLLYCFFKDFNEIREYLQEKWCDYNEGLLSLSTVSVVTNTAFDMFQKAERELLSYFPRNLPQNLRITRDFEGIAMYLFAEGGLAHVDYEEATRRTETEDDSQAAMYEEASWVCLPTFWCLRDWLRNAPAGKIPTMPDILSKPLKYDVEMSDEKIARDGHLLREFIAECCILKKLKQDGCPIPAEDELTKGITKMLITREVPIWLVFACQIFIDIRNIMDQEYDRGHKELVMMGERAKSIVEGQFAFNPEEETPDQLIELLDIVCGEVKCWVEEDFVEPGRTNLHSRAGMTKEQIGEFYYLRRHPLICGLQTFRFALTLNEHGLTTSNIYGSTIAAIHLYNAVRHQIQSSTKWTDMEALMLIHGKDEIFWGDIPDNPRDYRRVYDNASGVESMIAQREKVGVIVPTKVRRRGISPVSIVSIIFHDRYCFRNDRPGVTLPAVEHVLNRLAQQKMQDQLKGLRILIEQDLADGDSIERIATERAHADRAELAGAHDETLASQYEMTKTLTGKQLLEALNRRLTDEFFTLNFDYFSFHHRCTRVLRAVHIEFKDDIEKEFKAKIHQDRGELPMLPYYVFLLLEKDANIANRLAQIIKKFATEEGSAEVAAVREWMNKTKRMALSKVPIVSEYISGEDSDEEDCSDADSDSDGSE